MILVQKELQSNIHEAFKENCARENLIHVKALDRDISINYQSLAIFSPYFRRLISSAPCCTEPTLFLPEFSVSSVTSFMSLVTQGTTEDSIKSPGEAAEIIKVAKAFDIDASDYSVVVQDNCSRSKKGNKLPKVVSTFNGTGTEDIVKEEPSIQDQEELYDQGKDEALLTEELDMEGNQSEHNNITPDDESVMQNASLSQANVNNISKDCETNGIKCQICPVSHTKLSVLHIHYIHAHFMQEARSEFRSFASEKTCDLCGKVCKTSQQLFVHIGVKHKKVNMLLARHGYKEHIKPMRSIREAAEPLHTESTSCNDDPSNSSKAVGISKSNSEGCESSDKKLNTCQLCDKSIVGLGFLWQHYTTSHFTKDIKQSYGSLMDFENLKCKLCDKKMKQRQGLLTHMGAVHHKVNEVLVKYGLTPLEIKNTKHDRSSLDISS